MKPQTYNQCTLQRLRDESSTETIISWIPTQFAIVNKIISLKENNKWSDWKVITIGPPHSAKQVEENADSWRNYIKNTDI